MQAVHAVRTGYIPGLRQSTSRKERDGKQAQADSDAICPTSEDCGRAGRDDLFRFQFDHDRDHRRSAVGAAVCGAPIRTAVLPLSQDRARDRSTRVCLSRPSVLPPGAQLGPYPLGPDTVTRVRGKLTFSDGQVVWHNPLFAWRVKQVAEAVRGGSSAFSAST